MPMPTLPFPAFSTAGFGSDSTSYPLPRRRVEARIAICVSPAEHDNSMMRPGGASKVVNFFVLKRTR
jgi:hypothetical protein